ncbi:MAG: radical SAM protein [Planctomycetota bacterium]|nr:radical SAM protein [Planctomycetota bacterium]
MAARRILIVVWEITLQCNLGCRHCGSRAGPARAHELTTAEAFDVIRQLGDLKVREVTLIGGEALLRPDWDVLAKEIRRRGMHCSMVTGGRGLDASVAQRARNAGIENVSISIDGLEATHDALRGVKGSYRACLEGLRHLREAGVPGSVNSQVNTRSAGELFGLLDVLAAEKVWAWRLALTVAMGRAADRPDLLLQPYELLDVFPMLARLKVEAYRRGVGVYPGSNIGYFGPFEATLRGNVTEAGHWTGCSAGDETLGLEADGTIKGCPSLPTQAYAGGNVRERPIVELLEATPQMRFTRERGVDDLWGFCRTCYYAETCRAGCSWTAHCLLGRPGNNPMCHHRALEMRKRGLRERLVPVRRAPGEPFDHGLFELVEEPADDVPAAAGS